MLTTAGAIAAIAGDGSRHLSHPCPPLPALRPGLLAPQDRALPGPGAPPRHHCHAHHLLPEGPVLPVPGGWAPQLISVAAVVALHLWRHNNLLSIFGGTILYMVLVQTVFA